MIEQDLRDGLAGALADEPPLSFDPDRLVARAQREIRRRRSLAGVGGATVVITVAAVIAATLLHPATAGQAAAAGPHLNTAPSTTPAAATPPPNFQWPPAGIHVRAYSAAEETALASAWTLELAQTFPRTVPDASQMHIQAWGGEASGSIATGQDYLDTFVKFTIHGMQTAMAVQVAAPGQYSLSPTQACAESTAPDQCEFAIGSDGGLLLSYDIVQGGGNTHLRSVTDFRPDGTVVFATAYNYDPTGSGPPGATPNAIPLTDGQLTTFAIDPLLAF